MLKTLQIFIGIALACLLWAAILENALAADSCASQRARAGVITKDVHWSCQCEKRHRLPSELICKRLP